CCVERSPSAPTFSRNGPVSMSSAKGSTTLWSYKTSCLSKRRPMSASSRVAIWQSLNPTRLMRSCRAWQRERGAGSAFASAAPLLSAG
ncbi:unnamed protein product, partial [Ostreobium quekettii]